MLGNGLVPGNRMLMVYLVYISILFFLCSDHAVGHGEHEGLGASPSFGCRGRKRASGGTCSDRSRSGKRCVEDGASGGGIPGYPRNGGFVHRGEAW